jgi:dihydrofolate reductase
MAKLHYSGIMSLDGYINDENGNFDWSQPDAEVHGFVNDLERHIGTHLYGRRLYDVMVVWETMPLDDQPDEMVDYARIWQAANKVVYSATLTDVASERTRIENEFDPAVVRRLKATADRDLSIGGAELAAQAIRAGLVDEYHLFLSPIVVGGGTPFLPHGVRLPLELLEERRFGNGVVYLRYRAA